MLAVLMTKMVVSYPSFVAIDKRKLFMNLIGF